MSFLKKLEYFFFNLSEGDNNCSGSAFEILVKSLRNSSQRLETVMLYFWGGKHHLGSNEIGKAGKLISQTKRLKTLELSAGSGQNESNDASFSKIAKSLREIFTLQSLSLFFT